MKHTNFKMKAIAAAIGLTTLAGSASAQELEVITVTSQKRAQSLSDVPLSVQAVSGDLLQSQNITDFSTLAERLPNVVLLPAPGPSSISIRGVGTGAANSAAEQSVGLYVDGLYVSRGHQFNAPFTDVQQVEVLKGPQGVLQGKNSVAGAIVITSARPTSEFEASVRASYEVENEGYNLEGMVSGALTDNLFARVVAQQNFVGGWLDTNTRFANDGTTVLQGHEDQNESEFSMLRASLVWEASDTVTVFAKAETGKKEIRGTSFGPSSIQEGPAGDFIHALFLSKDPDFDFIGNGIISGGFPVELNTDLAGVNPITGAPIAGLYEAGNRELGTDVDSSSYTAQVDWDLGSGTLTSISTYSEFEHGQLLANPMAPFDWLTSDSPQGEGGEDFDQLTQEIRFVSQGGETIDYIVGAFYMDRNIDLNGSYSPTNLSNSGLDAFLPPLPLPPEIAPFFATTQDAFSTRFFNENTKSLSVFAQLTWNVSDDLRINAGARYSDETKTIDVERFDTFLQVQPAINAGLLAVFGREAFTTADLEVDEINEAGIDPSLSVQWDFNDDMMLYASATKATKAGGFNSSANKTDNFHFDSEEATGYEIGLKGNSLNKRLFFNAALFSTQFDDLQVSALDTTTNSFFFRNAATATTEGLEVDVRFALTKDVEIGGAMAYTDATYDDFPGATCSTGTSREADCDPVTNSRNAKGDKLTAAPEYSGSIYATYHVDFDNGMTLALRTDVIITDDFYLNGQNSPDLLQEAYTKLDASASLTSADGDWTVSINGKNLTNKTTSSFGGATPLFEGAFWSNQDAPRQIFLTAEYKWY